MREKELIIYRHIFGKEGKLLADMSWIMEHYRELEPVAGDSDRAETMKEMFYGCIHELLELAGNHGFYGNLWHCFLANLLVNNENSYSRACEVVGAVEGSINQAALHDIVIFKEFFDFDFAPLQKLGKRAGRWWRITKAAMRRARSTIQGYGSGSAIWRRSLAMTIHRRR